MGEKPGGEKEKIKMELLMKEGVKFLSERKKTWKMENTRKPTSSGGKLHYKIDHRRHGSLSLKTAGQHFSSTVAYTSQVVYRVDQQCIFTF